MEIIKIQEYKITKSLIVEIEVINYTLNVSAVVQSNLIDADKKPISSLFVYIEGCDYITQSVDDNILINIVIDKLGIKPSGLS